MGTLPGLTLRQGDSGDSRLVNLYRRGEKGISDRLKSSETARHGLNLLLSRKFEKAEMDLMPR